MPPLPFFLPPGAMLPLPRMLFPLQFLYLQKNCNVSLAARYGAHRVCVKRRSAASSEAEEITPPHHVL
jgi:hypothetical protein